MTDNISRLRAGLDRDETIARAIDDKQADSGWGIATTPGYPGIAISPHIGVVHESEAAEHITTHDPSRVLHQVEALREIADRAESAANNPGSFYPDQDSYDAGYWEAMADVVEILARTYPDTGSNQ